jgi:hypothetical protein
MQPDPLAFWIIALIGPAAIVVLFALGKLDRRRRRRRHRDDMARRGLRTRYDDTGLITVRRGEIHHVRPGLVQPTNIGRFRRTDVRASQRPGTEESTRNYQAR